MGDAMLRGEIFSSSSDQHATAASPEFRSQEVSDMVGPVGAVDGRAPHGALRSQPEPSGLAGLEVQTQVVIDVWNAGNNARAISAPQEIFNILGHVHGSELVETLHFSLNGGPARPVFFATSRESALRLSHVGDFNIDTIGRNELALVNNLKIIARLKDGGCVQRNVGLLVDFPEAAAENFTLTLDLVDHPEEVGQSVNGRWQIGRDEAGRRCLEISPTDIGLDRIILFGHSAMRDGYVVDARLRITQWLPPPHSVGLVFKWKPHLQGDGSWLPSQWTTGLAYYCSSEYEGIRLRLGVDVHNDARGRKVGSHVLGQSALSRWRRLANAALTRLSLRRLHRPQLRAGTDYRFHLLVRPDRHELTVWPECQARPSKPTVVADNPPPLIEAGAIGIIAHRCAVQVYAFSVSRLEEA
jgi:hypothetical protein